MSLLQKFKKKLKAFTGGKKGGARREEATPEQLAETPRGAARDGHWYCDGHSNSSYGNEVLTPSTLSAGGRALADDVAAIFESIEHSYARDGSHVGLSASPDLVSSGTKPTARLTPSAVQPLHQSQQVADRYKRDSELSRHAPATSDSVGFSPTTPTIGAPTYAPPVHAPVVPRTFSRSSLQPSKEYYLSDTPCVPPSLLLGRSSRDKGAGRTAHWDPCRSAPLTSRSYGHQLSALSPRPKDDSLKVHLHLESYDFIPDVSVSAAHHQASGDFSLHNSQAYPLQESCAGAQLPGQSQQQRINFSCSGALAGLSLSSPANTSIKGNSGTMVSLQDISVAGLSSQSRYTQPQPPPCPRPPSANGMATAGSRQLAALQAASSSVGGTSSATRLSPLSVASQITTAAAAYASAQSPNSQLPPLAPSPGSAVGSPCGSATVLAVSDMLPVRMRRPAWALKDYFLLQHMHKGYASNVYQARCNVSGEIVALKIYSLSKQCDIQRVQLYREIRLHSSVKHSNVINFYVAFKEGDSVVIVQEFAAGGDLLRLMRKCGGRISEREAVCLVLQPFLSALHYLHTLGIVHRDVKPENVLFTADKVLKLADFGLAIDLNEERPNTRAGTLDYMAPEVLHCPIKATPDQYKTQPGARCYDCGADAWAVGAFAYELVVGAPPFQGPGMIDTARNIVSAQPVFPQCLSEHAKEFIGRALAKHPVDRPTAYEMLHHPWITMFQRRCSILGSNQQQHGTPPHPQHVPGQRSLNPHASWTGPGGGPGASAGGSRGGTRLSRVGSTELTSTALLLHATATAGSGVQDSMSSGGTKHSTGSGGGGRSSGNGERYGGAPTVATPTLSTLPESEGCWYTGAQHHQPLPQQYSCGRGGPVVAGMRPAGPHLNSATASFSMAREREGAVPTAVS